MGTGARGIPFVAGQRSAAFTGAPARRAADGRALTAFAELAPIVARPEITDVFVHGGRVWVDAGDGLTVDHDVVVDDVRARALATALIAEGGRHLDEASPSVDVSLGDGIRVHAMLPPLSRAPELSIRLPRPERLDLAALDDAGMFQIVPKRRMERWVRARTNLLITGAGGSGKTTLLAALLSAANPNERIIAIEDVAELRIDHPHVVHVQTRQANVEGAGEVTLERLVRESLRMRPDRLVLGECRGAEIRELLAALNTGHDGGAGTLHANSLADVPARLEALGALAGMTTEALARQAVSAIGAVIHVVRTDTGRRVDRVGTLALDGTRLVVRDG